MAELSLFVKATVVLVAALAVGRAASRAAASVRALILSSAFGVLLLFPLVTLIAQPRPVVIPVESVTDSLLFVDDFSVALPAISSGPQVAASSARGTSLRIPSRRVVLWSAWAIGFAVFITPMATALWRLRGMRRGSERWTNGSALIATVAAQAGVARPVEVMLSPEIAAPMTYGVIRSRIMLPSDAPTWSATDLRQALLHELEHVRRRDWPVQLLARTVCALYWPHPLTWAAWRQLRLECERAADDAVLRNAEGTAYAEQLVSLARRVARSSAPLLSMAEQSNLSRRVSALLARDLARGRPGVLITALVILIASAIAVVISPIQAVTTAPTAASSTAQATGPATTTASNLSFEVASVRRNTSGEQIIRGAMIYPGGRFTAMNVPVRFLIANAYGLPLGRVTGGPPWIDSDRFDIEARAAATASLDDFRAMLRALLADRFKLVIRVEPTERPIFALVRAQENGAPGPQLRLSGPECAPIKPPTGGRGLPPPPPTSSGPEGGTPLLPPGGRAVRCGRMFFPGYLAARQITISDFATSLTNFAQRPVVDRTGLTGEYDLDVTFSPQMGIAADSSPSDGLPTLFTALQEQLGLKLEPDRAVIDLLAIVGVEPPGPN